MRGRRESSSTAEVAGSALCRCVFETLSPDGIPTRAGMDNLVRSIQAQGRFLDKKPAFTELAGDRLAKEVARELDYTVR